jgi:hypothetical protein
MRYLFDKQRVGDCSNRRKDGLGKNKKTAINKPAGNKKLKKNVKVFWK